MIVLVFIVLLFCAWACQSLARQKHHNPTVWAITGLLFGLLGLLVAIFMRDWTGTPLDHQVTRTQ